MSPLEARLASSSSVADCRLVPGAPVTVLSAFREGDRGRRSLAGEVLWKRQSCPLHGRDRQSLGIHGYDRPMFVGPRPPVLAAPPAFRQVVASGALIQRELLNVSSFSSAAQQRGISVSNQQLEAWDRDGVLRPLAFATGPWMSWRTTDPYPTDGMVFRDEQAFVAWKDLEYDLHGHSVRSPLYSEWQLLQAAEAAGLDTVTVSLDAFLGDPKDLSTIADRVRAFTVPTRAGLDDAWAALASALVQLQARYWPPVHGRSVLLIRSGTAEYVDALDLEHERATAAELASSLDLDAQAATELYEWLARRGQLVDPVPESYDLRRLRPRRLVERERGAARLASDFYDAALMLRRLVRDLTGDLRQDVDELDWPDKEPRPLARTHAHLMGALRRHRLYPHRLHLVVEGETEVALITRLFEAFSGTDLESAGIAMTDLGGDKLEGSRPMLSAFGAYANAVALLLDNENDVERITRQLKEDSGLGELYVELVEPSLEEANFTVAELLRIVAEMASADGVRLELDAETVSKGLASHNQGRKRRKGLASIIQSLARNPKHGAFSFTKPDLGRHMAEQILAEVREHPDHHDGVAEQRPVVRWVLDYPVRAAQAGH